MASAESKISFRIPLTWRHGIRVTFRERERETETVKPELADEDSIFIPLEFTQSGFDRITRMAVATGVSEPSEEEFVAKVVEQSISSREWIISQQAQGRAVVSIPSESLDALQVQGLGGEVFPSVIPDNRKAHATVYYDPSIKVEGI